MSRVILQPCGSAESQKHFKDTIENPVSLGRIQNFVSKEVYEELKNIYPDGYVPTWGVVPGKNDVNVKQWKKIQHGFIALFSGQNKIFASGTVTYTRQIASLAAELWDYDKDGQTWEYIYFLDEMNDLNIPYPDFNKVVGYQSKVAGDENEAVIYQFRVLDEEKSQKVIDAFHLESEVHLPPITEEQFTNAVDALEGKDSLDAEAMVHARKEQNFLRNTLFGNRTIVKCGICNREYPISFLIAAHIKKRAACSLSEKKDYKFIVMPMCKLGCDELYERGYISINSRGKVIDLNAKPMTPIVKDYISGVVNKDCIYWNTNTAPYFMWHLELHTRHWVKTK